MSWRKASKLTMALVFFLSILVLAGCGGSNGKSDGKTLKAVSVKDQSVKIDDPNWSKAPALDVELIGADVENLKGKKLNISAKAVWTSSDLYMLLRWPDSTESMTKGAWAFDGSAWKRQKGDEDRVSILWEISTIDKFATKGCAVLCHSDNPDQKKWYYATNSNTERADLWHWKSYRSNPLGFADDGYVVYNAESKSGRKSDPGSGGDSKNETEAKDKPKFRQDPSKSPSAKGFLLEDEVAEIKDYSTFKAGDTLPYRILSKPSGSRGDIKAQGVYRDGGWTVLLSRKLDTGHDDDVKFNTAKPQNFAIAVFDNSGDEASYNSGPLKLIFTK